MRVFCRAARRSHRDSGTMENVGRLVARGRVGAGRVGFGDCVSSGGIRREKRWTAARTRAISRVPRCETWRMVYTRNVRLMYTELHARSAFSFLKGSSMPEELIRVCAERGMPAMALLDRDGVYGAPQFHLAAKKLKPPMRAHVGAEVTAEDGWRYPLIVETREGYQNLCRLITRMKMRAKKGEGHVLADEMKESCHGLGCLTGGTEGPLADALVCGGLDEAEKRVRELCETFGHWNVYVELQRHFCRDEEARNQAAVMIAQKLKLPLLTTNGVSHAQVKQREVLDVFTCIRHHRTLSTAGRLLSRNCERHLKSPEEMTRLFADLPEAIANTQVLSARLEFTLENLGYQFPDYTVPDGKSP